MAKPRLGLAHLGPVFFFWAFRADRACLGRRTLANRQRASPDRLAVTPSEAPCRKYVPTPAVQFGATFLTRLWSGGARAGDLAHLGHRGRFWPCTQAYTKPVWATARSALGEGPGFRTTPALEAVVSWVTVVTPNVGATQDIKRSNFRAKGTRHGARRSASGVPQGEIGVLRRSA